MLQPLTQPVPQAFDRERPWNRQPFDDDEAWPAFRLFLQMARPRSVQALSQRHGIPYKKVRRWQEQYGWTMRAKAFDQHVETHWNEAVITTVMSSAEEVATRHLSIVRSGLALAQDQLAKLIETSQRDTMHGLLSPSETIKLLETCIKLERLVMGDSTGKLDVNIDLSQLNEQELITLQNAQQKILETNNNE